MGNNSNFYSGYWEMDIHFRKPNPKMPNPYVVKFWPETWASKPHYWHFYEREEVEQSTYDKAVAFRLLPRKRPKLHLKLCQKLHLKLHLRLWLRLRPRLWRPQLPPQLLPQLHPRLHPRLLLQLLPELHLQLPRLHPRLHPQSLRRCAEGVAMLAMLKALLLNAKSPAPEDCDQCEANTCIVFCS